MAFSRLYLFFLVLIPSVSNADACRPESRLCNLFVGKLSFIFTNISDLLFWVVLFFLAIYFLHWFADIVYKLFYIVTDEVSTRVSGFFHRGDLDLSEDWRNPKSEGDYKLSPIGDYVQLPDGSFVSADSKQARWLEYDGQTVHFSNSEFDHSRREMFDDPALDYLGKEQPEIIGYNARYDNDVYSGGYSANAVDDGWDEEVSARWGWSRIFDRETGEDITDDPYDDWRG